MEVEIHLFGALKRFGQTGIVALDVPEGCTALDIRELVKQKLTLELPGVFQGLLVDRAALANNNRVLRNEEQVDPQATLALLPPVCGG